ncbi:MAG TPA: DUF1559 domain-containing protein [Gemmataceae bacterium]|nr:DUF1559 domain-containing protein [Gemmataceae bacterium]
MKWLRTTGIIAAVLVGAALLIEAVKKIRAAEARTHCINNSKQLGLTLLGYHDSQKRFPSAIAAKPTKEFPPDVQLSWVNETIPWLEAHMDPKWITNRKLPWDHPDNQYVTRRKLQVYVCPSNPRVDDPFYVTHYVGITGIGKDAAWLPTDDANAGMFGYERKVTIPDLKNGLANVIMISETATDNGPWARGGFSTSRGFDRHGTAYLGEAGQFSANHSGISQVCMADGTVRPLAEDTSDEVLEALAILAPKH